MAWMAASASFGVGGESEIVVRGEVDDLLAVVVADGRLHIVEDAEMEVGSPGLELVELGGEVLELGSLRKNQWT